MNKIIYSLIATATVMFGVECSAQTFSGLKEGHGYVNLGLPSGTLWAVCNVGATTPVEYGSYFAWGENSPKEDYTWSTYKWCNGSIGTKTKYCTNSNNGTVDSLLTLVPADDMATASWGSAWRTPTNDEMQELFNNCTWEWTSDFKGVAGMLGTSKTNGSTIFLPAAGHMVGTDLRDAGHKGFYWSSSLFPTSPDNVYSLNFDSSYIDWYYNYCNYGQVVRAVMK